MAANKEPNIDSNTIIEMKISELHPFQNHPFKVLDDELMQQTIDSIAQVGVLSPAVVRPDPGGGYEIISGHRRLHACKAIGFETIPVMLILPILQTMKPLFLWWTAIYNEKISCRAKEHLHTK